MQWWFVGAAALAGCFIAVQAAANSAFRASLDSPWYAAFFSITGTMVCAVLFLICLRPPLPTSGILRTTQWWNWIGGPLGAAFVLSGTLLVPRLGTATFLAAAVAGQLTRVSHRSFRPNEHQPALYLIRKASRRRFGRQWRTSSEISLRRNSEPTY